MLSNRKKLIMFQNWSLMHIELSSWACNMLQIKERSQKLTPYLFQNDVVLYFECYCYFWSFDEFD